jgi:hypothetical protein
MDSPSTQLVVMGGLTLLVLALATPVSADSGRHHWRPHWDDRRPHQEQNYRRHRDRTKIFSGSRHYRYFGADPDRYFGVGPGSYECYGYDCTW